VAALRPPVGARRVRAGDVAREMDDAEARLRDTRRARRLVECDRRCGVVPGRADHLARARVQYVRLRAALRHVRQPARVGAPHARRAPPRSARACLLARAVRRRGDARSAVERGPAAVENRRLVPRLHADAVGQEDPRVVAHAGGRAPRDGAPDEPLLARRTRSELVGRLRVGAGALRSAVARTRDLRDRALHVVGQHRAKATGEKLSVAVWWPVASRQSPVASRATSSAARVPASRR
jgi:hypothetical protein